MQFTHKSRLTFWFCYLVSSDTVLDSTKDVSQVGDYVTRECDAACLCSLGCCELLSVSESRMKVRKLRSRDVLASPLGEDEVADAVESIVGKFLE